MSTKNAIITVLAIAVLGLLWWNFVRKEPAQPMPEPEQPIQAPHSPKEVKRQNANEESDYYAIEAYYPETENKAVNNTLKEFVLEQAAQFKEDTGIADITSEQAQELGLGADRKYSLSVDYDLITGADAYTYLFTIDMDTGGAHGNQHNRTFSFNENGSEIELAGLFQPGKNYLAVIAGYAQAELKKREFADADWIAEGAGEKAENFQSFIIRNDGIEFMFDPYQVAAYAAGPQRVLVPYSVLKPLLRPQFFPN